MFALYMDGHTSLGSFENLLVGRSFFLFCGDDPDESLLLSSLLLNICWLESRFVCAGKFGLYPPLLVLFD